VERVRSGRTCRTFLHAAAGSWSPLPLSVANPTGRRLRGAAVTLMANRYLATRRSPLGLREHHHQGAWPSTPPRQAYPVLACPFGPGCGVRAS